MKSVGNRRYIYPSECTSIRTIARPTCNRIDACSPNKLRDPTTSFYNTFISDARYNAFALHNGRFTSCEFCTTVFSSTGRRPASLCHGPLSVVRQSIRPCVRPVRALTFSLNIFFSETTYRILMKFHRNVSTMVLFRIS